MRKKERAFVDLSRRYIDHFCHGIGGSAKLNVFSAKLRVNFVLIPLSAGLGNCINLVCEKLHYFRSLSPEKTQSITYQNKLSNLHVLGFFGASIGYWFIDRIKINVIWISKAQNKSTILRVLEREEKWICQLW